MKCLKFSLFAFLLSAGFLALSPAMVKVDQQLQQQQYLAAAHSQPNTDTMIE